jgi:hypothetical protein
MFAQQLHEAVDPVGGRLAVAAHNLFEWPEPVLEWIELVERRGTGQGDLSRLLFSLEAFIEKVSPELRKAAEREGQGGWWPAVHAAAKLAYLGRQIGLTDTREKMPQYTGKFDANLFQRMLKKISSESDHAKLKRTADKALQLAPA